MLKKNSKTYTFLRKIKHGIDAVRRFVFCGIIGKYLAKSEKSPMYVVYVEGGLCSQMQQYMHGRYLAEQGKKVKYDISCYDTCKTTGINARSFELLRIFPDLPFEKASLEEVKRFKRYYFYKPDQEGQREEYGNLPLIPDAPCYVGGFYNIGVKTLLKYQEVFHPVLDENHLNDKNRILLEKIRDSEHSVGVHVRRGDMAFSGGYWDVLTPDYFVKAIERFDEKCSFFFFSDEPEWVEKEVFPLLSKELKLYIAPRNNPVWVDFYLMLQCNSYIASQGSMGKYVWLLSPKSHLVMAKPSKKMEWYYLKDQYNIDMIEI